MKNHIDHLFATDEDALRHAYFIARALDTDPAINGSIKLEWNLSGKEPGYALLCHIKELADRNDLYALFELAEEIESRYDSPVAA